MKRRCESLIEIYRIFVMWTGAALNALFGSTDGVFLTLIVFMAVEYAAWACCSLVGRKRSGKTGVRKFAKKMGILCIVSLASLIERNILETTAIRDAVILYYISNEGISIFESLAKIGVPIPKKLKDVLEKISDKEDKNV